MYKDDYISAFGKLAPSEAWKAETLEKMHALEKQQREGRAGSGGAPASAAASASAAAPASASGGLTVSASASAAAPDAAFVIASDTAHVSAPAGSAEPAATGHAPTKNAFAKNAPAKKWTPLAVHLRRAALPIAAAVMLAILPMTALRGCGASGGNSSAALQMEDRASDGCAPAAADPAPRDTAGGAENGTTAQTPAAAPSGGAGLYDGALEEAQCETSSAQSMAPAPEPAPALSPGMDSAGEIGGANMDSAGDFEAAEADGAEAFERKKFEIAYGGRPFRALKASEITFATVSLTPPDTTLEIPDLEELAGLLQDVIVYSRDDSYTEYSGQGVIFALTFEDGTQTQIIAYNPFLIIDGTGYRTEYAPCEALNHYANMLLDGGEAVTVLEQPPAMAVIGTLDETYHSALMGGYSWQSKSAGGTFVNTEADGAHPLDCREQLSPALEMTYDHTLNLLFPEGAAPDEIVRVRCWSDANWGITTAKGEAVRVQSDAAGGGYAIEVKPGGYIYEVTARWDTADGYGGTASYAFYVKGIG